MNATVGRWLKVGGASVVILVILAQLIPVDRTNPPAGTEVDAPSEVVEVLRRSCYDCHSNETRWPWYSGIAPASWLVARDVREGREAVNYSTWERYSPEERRHHQEETWEDVEEGEMPLGVYTLMHPGARLSARDLEVLRAWASEGVSTRPGIRAESPR